VRFQSDSTIEAVDSVERALLQRAADGSRAALERLYQLYHSRLFKFLFRLTGSYTTADELVNDIMLLVWQKAATFRGESKVSTWIFGIAYRQAVRHLSRSKPLLTLGGRDDEFAAREEKSVETEDWVRLCIDSLPRAQQMTVVLVFYLGLTYEETAAVTDCPVNTVKTRMFHARQRLKELLEQHAVPPASRSENHDD